MRSGEDLQRMLLSPTARRLLRDFVRALLPPGAVRYDPVDPVKAEAVFAKLYTGESGAQAFRSWRKFRPRSNGDLAFSGKGVGQGLPCHPPVGPQLLSHPLDRSSTMLVLAPDLFK